MFMQRHKITVTFSYVQALISLFVFSTRDGWVEIMHNGIDAVGINQQVQHLSLLSPKNTVEKQVSYDG